MKEYNTSKMSKKQYRALVNDALSIFLSKRAEYNTVLWNSIVNQIKDIKKEVVDNQNFKGWDDINDRYTLGMIAIHEFDDGDKMQTLLCDVFSGAMDYYYMPEE